VLIYDSGLAKKWVKYSSLGEYTRHAINIGLMLFLCFIDE